MTDNEIIKAFKMHLLDNRDCELCPYGPAYYRCSIILLKDVLDLINRQQGEIEKLEKETQDKERAYNDEFCLRKEWQTKCQELLKDKQTTKSEAVKEFAERLKEQDGYDNHVFDDCASILVPKEYLKGRDEKIKEVWTTIDNLVKEMVGENNG